MPALRTSPVPLSASIVVASLDELDKGDEACVVPDSFPTAHSCVSNSSHRWDKTTVRILLPTDHDATDTRYM